MFNLKTKRLSFAMLTLLVLAGCNNNSSSIPSLTSSPSSTASSQVSSTTSSITSSSSSSTSSISSSSSSSELPSEEQYQIFILAQQSGYTGTYEEWLDSIKGADGASLLSGTTNPEATLGKNGDTYINTTSWDVYVKSGGNWTKVGNVMGPKGDKGDPGEDGLTPYIGTNGNWWIGDTDTGVSASGTTSDLNNSQTFTVTFDSNGGTSVPSQQVKRLDKVIKPEDPIKNGYMFDGWYIGNERWVFSGYNVTDDITLTAQYQLVENGTDGLLFTPTIYEGKQSYVVSGYEGTSKDVIIPSTFNGVNVVGIGTNTFLQKEIETIFFSNEIKFIGDNAFTGNLLASVSIPNSVTTIGASAFGGNQLTSVTIPNSVTTIGHSAFYNNRLTSISIPNSVTTIGYEAFAFNQLTSVTIPNSVTMIERFVFLSNRLTSVTIPNSVTTIGASAFGGNQLTSVTIPNSVTTIEYAAFSHYNSEAFTIYVEAAVIPEGWNQNWYYSENASVTIVLDYKNQ